MATNAGHYSWPRHWLAKGLRHSVYSGPYEVMNHIAHVLEEVMNHKAHVQ